MKQNLTREQAIELAQEHTAWNGAYPRTNFEGLCNAAIKLALETKPIDMVLHCPKCHMQHIDEPEGESEYTARLHESSWWELGGEKPQRWTNPPHKSHLCRKSEGGCGTVWRPADVPTNGVLALQTKGAKDTWP